MSTVLETTPLGFPWPTTDPFLFCVHHDDAYPRGDDRMGPAAPLVGRNIGQDFEGKDGWRMYHGSVVPGFPQHPHRGFETVTVVRRGYVDHADSLGATARYGQGDVQWLTAGRGISHCEMFPLVERERPNPVELFQLWLNLPSADKLAEPHFAMLWGPQLPVVSFEEGGRRADVQLVAGELGGRRPPAPPPRSWASRADSDVAIWTLRLDEGAKLVLPPARHPRAVRTLYFFRGGAVRVGDHKQRTPGGLVVRSDAPLALEALGGEVELLLLQGRPIGEPVVQHGPFVMNTKAEIQRTVADYQATRFGGWPWSADDPVHPRDAGRFAKRPDGTIERPPEAAERAP